MDFLFKKLISCICPFVMYKTKVLLLLFIWFIFNSELGCSWKLKRNKRFLIFPRQAPTRHQFIGGIGIPTDLAYESLTIGYVLKAEFWLPFNATVFRENPYLPEYKKDRIQTNQNFINTRSIQVEEKKSTLRWVIYDILIHRLDGYGYNGQECFLRAICEANALQFMRHSDVFGELMHIFFSPSTSRDLKTADTQNYIQAEKLGLSGDSCTSYDCNISILDVFSKVF